MKTITDYIIQLPEHEYIYCDSDGCIQKTNDEFKALGFETSEYAKAWLNRAKYIKNYQIMKRSLSCEIEFNF